MPEDTVTIRIVARETASSALKRVRQDIAQAAVDFKKGSLSARDYATALNVAEQEARQLGVAQRNLIQRDIIQLNRSLGFVSGHTHEAAMGLRTAAQGTETLNTVARKAARQGLGTIRSSMASLTFMMLQAKGTLGTLASGLLQFAAGNAVAVGIIAGVAAIAGAYKLLNREAAAARKKADELLESLKKQREAEKPRLVQLTGQRRLLDENLDRERERLANQKAWKADAGAVRKTEERIAQLEAERLNLTTSIADERGKLRTTFDDELQVLQEAQKLGILGLADRHKALDLERRLTAALREGNLSLEERVRLQRQLTQAQAFTRVGIPAARVTPSPAPGLRGIGREDIIASAAKDAARLEDIAARLARELPRTAQGWAVTAEQVRLASDFLEQMNAKMARLSGIQQGLNFQYEQGWITEEQYRRGIAALNREMQKGGQVTAVAAAQMITAFGGLMQAAIAANRGGGIGGIFSALAGIALAAGTAGVLSPAAALVAGAGLTTIGGVFSAAGAGSVSTGQGIPVRLVGVDPTAESVLTRHMGPDRFTLQIVGATTGEVIRETIYHLHRGERRDARIRIPHQVVVIGVP